MSWSGDCVVQLSHPWSGCGRWGMRGDAMTGIYLLPFLVSWFLWLCSILLCFSNLKKKSLDPGCTTAQLNRIWGGIQILVYFQFPRWPHCSASIKNLHSLWGPFDPEETLPPTGRKLLCFERVNNFRFPSLLGTCDLDTVFLSLVY